MMEALDRRVHARLDEMDADEMDARVRESDASTWTPEAWYRWLRAAARREGDGLLLASRSNACAVGTRECETGERGRRFEV